MEEVRKVILVLGNKPAQCHIVSPQVNSQNKRALCSWEVWSGLPLNEPRADYHYQEFIQEGMRGKDQLWTHLSTWECWLFCIIEKTLVYFYTELTYSMTLCTAKILFPNSPKKLADTNFTFHFWTVNSSFLMRLFQLSSPETCQTKSGQIVTMAVSDEAGAGGHAPKLFSFSTVTLGEWSSMHQPCFWHQKLIS